MRTKIERGLMYAIVGFSTLSFLNISFIWTSIIMFCLFLVSLVQRVNPVDTSISTDVFYWIRTFFGLFAALLPGIFFRILSFSEENPGVPYSNTQSLVANNIIYILIFFAILEMISIIIVFKGKNNEKADDQSSEFGTKLVKAAVISVLIVMVIFIFLALAASGFRG